MAVFQLTHGSHDASIKFALLDNFTQGYITTMFWLAGEDLGEVALDQLAPEAWAKIGEDCADFKAANEAALAEAYAARPSDYDEDQAGGDFFLTRNGHGAGFWDRDLGASGEALSQAARAYGECDLYRGDDGRLYL